MKIQHPCMWSASESNKDFHDDRNHGVCLNSLRIMKPKIIVSFIEKLNKHTI